MTISAVSAIRTGSAYGNGKRVRSAPPCPQSRSQGGELHAPFPCPNRLRLHATIESQARRYPHVVALFALSGPLTVIRRIPPVIIDSFKGVFRGRLSAHVCDEVLKRGPSIGDRNTSRPVMLVRRVVRVLASLAHRLPSNIFRWLMFPEVRKAVLGKTRYLDFFVETTARDVRSMSKGCARNYLFISTITGAQPIGCVLPYERNFNSCESARTSAYQVV